MRAPQELSRDELATLKLLWALWPHEALLRPESDHRWVAPLVEDGYVEATRYDAGTGYRISKETAAGLTRMADRLAAQAASN